MLSPAISACDGTPSPPPNVLTAPEAITQGAALYARHCAICHGAKADGQGVRHAFMNPPPADLTSSQWAKPENAGRIYVAVRNGVPRTAMAGWPSLSDRQIWSLAAYIESLSR